MKVTEHNITDTDLNLKDIGTLIRLVKEDSKHYDDRATLLYYGVLIGKLICLRHDLMSQPIEDENNVTTECKS